MSIELLEPEVEIDNDEDMDTEGAPPIFGRCPVCKKPLFPREKITGEMKAPPVGTGYESRAKCGGCGAIICYVGNGNWRVVTGDDLTEDDKMADSLGM